MDRRNADITKEVRAIIREAAKEGAKEALILLGHEIAQTGIKKVLYTVGIALVSFLSALTAWFIAHGAGGPK